MENQVISFSSEALKERKRQLYIILGALPVIIAVISYIQTGLDSRAEIKSMLIFMGIIMLMILIVVFISSKTTFKKLSEMKLMVSDNWINRMGGRTVEYIDYCNIKSIKAKRNVKGKIQNIQICYGDNSIILWGFDEMDKVLLCLKNKINDNVVIKESQYRVNWNSPLVIILSIFLTTAVSITIFELFSLEISNMIDLVFESLFGLYLILFRPFSKKEGKRFREFEIFTAILCFISVILDIMQLRP